MLAFGVTRDCDTETWHESQHASVLSLASRPLYLFHGELIQSTTKIAFSREIIKSRIFERGGVAGFPHPSSAHHLVVKLVRSIATRYMYYRSTYCKTTTTSTVRTVQDAWNTSAHKNLPSVPSSMKKFLRSLKEKSISTITYSNYFCTVFGFSHTPSTLRNNSPIPNGHSISSTHHLQKQTAHETAHNNDVRAT